jgi:HEAT repeat protein
MRLVANPGADPEGKARAQLAGALRDSKDPRAVEVLIELLGKTGEQQPVSVHRQAITSLGALRALPAVDPILVAIFTIPDVPTTTNVAERAKVALASIGVAAVPSLVALLQGKHADVAKRAAENVIPDDVLVMTAAGMLAAFDEPAANAALLEALDDVPCNGIDNGMVRAVVSNALGQIGHAPAVPAICRCLMRDRDPGTGFPAAEALGRIGGDQATQCLVDVVASAAFDAESVASKQFVHELRWEAVRFAALAGGAEAVPTIRRALGRNTPHVREQAKRFGPMLDALQRCKDEAKCLDALMADPGADPFAREAAAFARARQEPESADRAAAVSKLFATRDPDVRLSVAVLTRRVAPPHACPQCTEAFRNVFVQELGSMDVRMQASVLAARVTIAAVGDDATHVPFPAPGGG